MSGPRPPLKRRAQMAPRSVFNPAATDTSEDMARWRIVLHDIIFEADTPGGRAFDIVLLLLISISVTAVMLETVVEVDSVYGPYLRAIEWAMTVIFTVEYILRFICVARPLGYGKSFFGIVDLLSVLPAYLSLVVAGAQAMAVVRVLRLLRVFRILNLMPFVGGAQLMLIALKASRPKIVVFLATVLTFVIILGATMYLVEGKDAGFTSIPRSVYWAIITLTTVGYGDIAPQSEVGQFIASAVMILGYSIIAVPTGIVSAELMRSAGAKLEAGPPCNACGQSVHAQNAAYCHACGAPLGKGTPEGGAV